MASAEVAKTATRAAVKLNCMAASEELWYILEKSKDMSFCSDESWTGVGLGRSEGWLCGVDCGKRVWNCFVLQDWKSLFSKEWLLLQEQ